MSGPQRLAEQAGILRTRMGAAFPGQRAVFRGRDLHAGLGDLDWLELYVHGITGRRFDAAQVRLLHALWAYTSYPDARLWNNRVAALAGSSRSSAGLGIGAAVAVSKARISGAGPGLSAYDYFTHAQGELRAGRPLEDIVGDWLRRHRGIGGYGRPLVAGDERIEPIMSRARACGLDQGEFVRLAFRTEDVLLAGRWRLHMNYAALVAAMLLELGFSRQAYQLFIVPVFLAGMPPCYLEAVGKAEGLTFPLACTNIRYEGPPARRWRSDNP